jgi:hypothetical protein
MLNTIAEIEAALAPMPFDSPERIATTKRLFALHDQVEAEKRRAAALPPISMWPRRAGLVTLAAPPGITHVELAMRPRVVASKTVVTKAGQGIEQTVSNRPVVVAAEHIDGHNWFFLEPADALRQLNCDQGAWRALNGDPGAHPHFPPEMFFALNGAPL